MTRVLVTGGSGFIGTNLINKLLENNYDVCNIDIKKPKVLSHELVWKNVDICDFDNLKYEIDSFLPEIIFHLAARTDLNGENLLDYDSNITGVKNLIRSVENLKCLKRIIFTSSMYVCMPGYTPKDSLDFLPHTLYGESKVLTEKIVLSSTIKCTWSIIRPTSIWGPWFGEPYINFFKMVRSGLYFNINNVKCMKTYGYIGNMIYQMLYLMNVDDNCIHKKVFYLGDYEPYDISEWAIEIAKQYNKQIINCHYTVFFFLSKLGDFLKFFGIRFPMTSFRLRNMTTNNIIDITEIQKLIEILPFSRLQGISETIKWMKNL